MSEVLFDPTEYVAGLPAGRLTYTSPCKNLYVVLDADEFEFYIEASPLCVPELLAQYIDSAVFALGYELIPEDECEPETTAEGWTRIYATPVTAAPDLRVERAMEAGHASIGLIAGISATALSTPWVGQALGLLTGVLG